MEPKEIIKSRLPIQEVIGSYMKLERAGASFRGLCPFHKEKSPSFNVSPARDAYYCFGCQKGGDIFAFIMEMEGMSFPEALKVLADRSGVQLPERHQRLPQEQDQKERLYAVMEEATKFFEVNLSKNTEVREYLHRRGLTDDTIARFRIGFVPEGWRNLYDFLRGRHFDDLTIERARLTKKVEGKGYYDTFRSRIMFPINDSSGRVIAFTGRVWGQETTKDGSAIAKYLNSPEGELYDKSRVLFGYDRAKIPMRKADRVILVEGQMDCIMSHQAGIENTVAISGTALTEPQLDLIGRLTKQIVISLDADSAGINAALRSAKLALNHGIQVLAIRVPDGKDPADYISSNVNNPTAWPEVLKNAEKIVPYLLRSYVAQGMIGESLRIRIEREVLPLVSVLTSSIERDQLAKSVAQVLDVSPSVVYEDMKRIAHENSIHHINIPNKMPSGDEMLVVVKKINPILMIYEELLSLIEFSKETPDRSFAHDEIKAHLERIIREFELPERNIDPSMHVRMLMQVEGGYSPNANLGEIAKELLSRIERDLIKEKQKRLLSEITRAEAARVDTSEFLNSYRALAGRLVALEDKK
jgi:DNA primase